MRRKSNVLGGIVEKVWREAPVGMLQDELRWKRPDNSEAFEAFDRLVSGGCDGVFLFSMLKIFAEAPGIDTWEGLTGFSNPDRLRTVLKRLRVCADNIEHLLGGVIGKSFFQSPSKLGLPSNLRDLADQFESVKKSNKPRKNVTGRAARAAIVRHVYDKTGNFKDELVARILAPTLRECDAVAQRVWRSENAAFITLVGRK